MHRNINIRDGQFTMVIYQKIRDAQYKEAAQILTSILQYYAPCRAALSLLAYCHYRLQQFDAAADCYARLVLLATESGEAASETTAEYRLWWSQALYQACRYDEALQQVAQVDHHDLAEQVLKLQAAVKYGQNEVAAAKSLVQQCAADDADTLINQACLLYKEERYEESLVKFETGQQIVGDRAQLTYNIALCHYQLKQYQPAMKLLDEMIGEGVRRHPELSVGLATEGVEVSSVGNTLVLHRSALVEAFNLKAAIHMCKKNYASAREALTDMPPRHQHELDAVTLHNQAIVNMDSHASDGFERLQYLLQQSSCPSETFGNLLLLYCQHELFHLAADVLAEHSDLTYTTLSPYLFELLDALIMEQTAQDEAAAKLDAMASRFTEQLRKLTQQHQPVSEDGQYNDTLQRYVPVLMAQARIFWNNEDYTHVEKLFRRSVDFCSELDVWKLNVAHVLFMQENKFKEAAGFYEQIVRKHYDDILGVSAIVLANLCVSYIMTSQNEEAEELMRKIEKEEEAVVLEFPERKIYHLCIVNLVIGTLYCSKGNYEFGISRVIKSLEPYQKKLGTDTWYYAKRCFLSLFEMLAKNMITVNDKSLDDCLQFLDNCQVFGRDIPVQMEVPEGERCVHPGRNTVTYEARLLRCLFSDLMIN